MLQRDKTDFTLNFVYMWVFQERFSSIFTRTQLKDLVGQSFPILSIISPPIDIKYKLLRLIFLLFEPNTINSVSVYYS